MDRKMYMFGLKWRKELPGPKQSKGLLRDSLEKHWIGFCLFAYFQWLETEPEIGSKRSAWFSCRCPSKPWQFWLSASWIFCFHFQFLVHLLSHRILELNLNFPTNKTGIIGISISKSTGTDPGPPQTTICPAITAATEAWGMDQTWPPTHI